jgi:hypothetical protein
MAINLRIEKRHLYLLSAILIFLVGISVVVAYDWTTGSGTGLPALHGHTSNEIEGGVAIGDGTTISPNCKGPAGYVYLDGMDLELTNAKDSRLKVYLKCSDGELSFKIDFNNGVCESSWVKGISAICPEDGTGQPRIGVVSGDKIIVNHVATDGGNGYIFTIPSQYIVSRTTGGGGAGGGSIGPACTLCESCGGDWPSYQGKFDAIDYYKFAEVRGEECEGEIGLTSEQVISLCCKSSG